MPEFNEDLVPRDAPLSPLVTAVFHGCLALAKQLGQAVHDIPEDADLTGGQALDIVHETAGCLFPACGSAQAGSARVGPGASPDVAPAPALGSARGCGWRPAAGTAAALTPGVHDPCRRAATEQPAARTGHRQRQRESRIRRSGAQQTGAPPGT